MSTKIPIDSKIRGMFYGIAIGDALGAPVETFSAKKIRDIHGAVKDYVDPIGHKWFDGRKRGFTTDDTQLTLAVAKALVSAGDFDMNAIAKAHVSELKNPAGWGGTTRRAIERIRDGVGWRVSGIEDVERSGCGNGVPMKVGPIAAWHYLTQFANDRDALIYEQVAEFGAMTHYTDMGVMSGIIHFDALCHCLLVDPSNFSVNYFCEDLDLSLENFESIYNIFNPTLKQIDDDLGERIDHLQRIARHRDISDRRKIWNNETIEEFFGNGGCYVYDSLPFSYAYFLRNPHSFMSLFDTVNAGGDTDTNASMVGSLLGALNGISIFPQDLVNQLQCKQEIDNIVNDFLELFGEKK